MNLEGYELVLGSSSKTRQLILESLGIPFRVQKPDLDEKQVCPHLRSHPSEYALNVAQAKMDILSKLIENKQSIIITCDQVVSWEGCVREKPSTKEECIAYLRGYESAPAETFSAVVVMNLKTGKRVQDVDVAKQFFTNIPTNIIHKLIEKGDVMHCCGGFMIDDDLIKPYLAKRIGDEDSIMGLPMRLLKHLLMQVI